MLTFQPLKPNMNPFQVMLERANIWVQVYDLSRGFMSEKVARDIGNYVRIFVKVDTIFFSGMRKKFMRIRVSIDVNKPIKHKMKIKQSGGEGFLMNFKYKKLLSFYFLYGVIRHSNKFCKKLYDFPVDVVEKLFDK